MDTNEHGWGKTLNRRKQSEQRDEAGAARTECRPYLAKHRAPADGFSPDRGQTGVLENKFIFLKLFGGFMPLKPRISPACRRTRTANVHGRANNLGWKLVREVGKTLLPKNLGSSFLFNPFPQSAKKKFV